MFYYIYWLIVEYLTNVRDRQFFRARMEGCEILRIVKMTFHQIHHDLHVKVKIKFAMLKV